jgi:aminopeptidase
MTTVTYQTIKYIAINIIFSKLGEGKMDKRWYELADILVNYSTQVKPGERVMISMRETHTLPLVRAVFEACIKVGAYPQVQFLSDYLDHSLMRDGNIKQVRHMPEIEAYGMEWADVYFGLRGAHNLYEFADIQSNVLTDYRKVMGTISSLRWEKTRWVIVRVPNEDFAQQAETDIETITDLFFDASLLDWQAETQHWQQLASKLNQGSKIRLIGHGTDLSFSLVGRQWMVGDGRFNMPDGEIFTAPIAATVNGKISFEFPGVLGGRLVHDMCLEWVDGNLMNATASKNEDFLKHVLATDEGASKIGEFAFGTNHKIDRFCKDIFYDEKIGGTIHIALGRAYPVCGGTNRSSIHWDIIKDTRQDGIIYMDGQKIFENGEFLF